VPAPDVGGGLLGFGVVGEPHECGGAAADQAGRVVAQVPEHERDRDAAPLAGAGQALGVRAGDLVGPCDDHRGHGRGRGRYLHGQPLHEQRGEYLAGGAARDRVHAHAGVPGRLLRPAGAGMGGQFPEDRVEADQVGGDLLPVRVREQAPGDKLLLTGAEQAVRCDVAEGSADGGGKPLRAGVAAERARELLQDPDVDRTVGPGPVRGAGVQGLGDSVGELGGCQLGQQPAAAELLRQVVGRGRDPRVPGRRAEHPCGVLAGQVNGQQRPLGENRGSVHRQQPLPAGQCAAEDVRPVARE
jgi:hypothetical protein